MKQNKYKYAFIHIYTHMPPYIRAITQTHSFIGCLEEENWDSGACGSDKEKLTPPSS